MSSEPPPDAYDVSLLVAVELLRDCQEAMHELATALLTVKPRLSEPYPDDPRWSPWTRFVKRDAERVYNLSFRIAKALRGLPTPPEEPWICGVCSKGHGGHALWEAIAHLYGVPDDEAKQIVRDVVDKLRE